MSPAGSPSARHTTWNYRRKSNCFRNRTCKSSEILSILICNNVYIYEVFLTVNVSTLFLQVLDRTTEETTGSGEDVDHEGQHNQHLCYGKKCLHFAPLITSKMSRLFFVSSCSSLRFTGKLFFLSCIMWPILPPRHIV